jgi:guanine deaminase
MVNAFMARAIQLSIENVRKDCGGPFGAVIARGPEIIAEGTNRVTATNDPTAHAEIVAIRLACQKLCTFELKDCEIYSSCEPCPMCLGAIYWTRLACVYFAGLATDASKAGFDDSLIYDEIGHPRGHRKIPMIPLMREQALEAFRLWATKPDKISY